MSNNYIKSNNMIDSLMIIYEMMNFHEKLTPRTLQLAIIKHDRRCLHYFVALFDDLLVILLVLGVHGGFGLCAPKLIAAKLSSVDYSTLISEIRLFF